MQKRTIVEKIHASYESLPTKISQNWQVGPLILQFRSTHEQLFSKLTRALVGSPTDHAPDFTLYLSSLSLPLEKSEWQLILQSAPSDQLYFHYFEAIQALSVIDFEERRAFYIVKKGAALPWWVEASPLQVIFDAIGKRKQLQLTHCACIGQEDRALILAGKGGAGKSTLTLAALTMGMDFYSEDYALLSTDGAVYSLYKSAKLTDESCKRFPFVSPYIQNSGIEAEKALIFYDQLFPKQIKEKAQALAIVCLKIGAQPRLEACSKSAALQALMLSTLFQLPFSSKQSASLLKNLVMQLPTYQLTLGPSSAENLYHISKLFLINDVSSLMRVVL